LAGPDAARWRDLIAAPLAPRAALVMLGVWLNAADALVTATIMPSVARDLGGYAFFGWAVAGYLLGSILAGASAGQLAQRLGLKPAMVGAAIAYAAGCALSAASPTIALFLAGRLLQGIGAGWIVGFCYVAIGVVFPERLWARMFGAASGVWGVATLLGPLVGGLFAAAGAWRGAFWLFALQGLAFALACLWLLGPGQADDSAAPRPLAWRTLSVLAAGIAAIGGADVVGGWLAPVGLIAAGLALLAFAGAINAGAGERLVPRDAVRLSTTAGAGYAMILAMSAAGSVLGVYGAAILQVVHGASPLTAGYAIGMEALAWTLAALIVSGQPDHRHGVLILAGAGTIVAGIVLMALTIGAAGLAAFILGAVVLGSGYGLSWSLATRRILAALPAEDRAVGASAAPTTQMIGGAVGAAAAGAVANLLGLTRSFTQVRAALDGPWLFAAFTPLALIGLAAAVRLTRRPLARASRSD
jgi:MFS family permease